MLKRNATKTANTSNTSKALAKSGAKKKEKKPKLKTLPQLEKELWKVFSLAIRLRDAEANGMCKCITCNTSIPYYGTSNCHAGHFRSRNEKPVKYSFRNVHAQCAYCNAYKNGEQFIYGQKIDELYGAGTAHLLYIQGKQTMKLTREYIEQIYIASSKLIITHATEKNLWDWKSGMTKTELNKITEAAKMEQNGL